MRELGPGPFTAREVSYILEIKYEAVRTLVALGKWVPINSGSSRGDKNYVSREEVLRHAATRYGVKR